MLSSVEIHCNNLTVLNEPEIKRNKMKCANFLQADDKQMYAWVRQGIADLEDFTQWCAEHRRSYWDGANMEIERLTDEVEFLRELRAS